MAVIRKCLESSLVPAIATCLMFEGAAEEALSFYKTVFADTTIESLERYGPGEPGKAGTIKVAKFTLAGHQMMCLDSAISHGFTFTPSTSLFVTFEHLSEIEAAYNSLSAGGGVLMPMANYGFSQKFGWVNDRFGVSWQLNLP